MSAGGADGAVARAVEAARDAAVLFELPAARVHDVQGADARELVGRLASNELVAGEVSRTLFLDGDGRILHRCLVADAPGGVRLVTERTGEDVPDLPDWLDRYTFGEEAQPRARPDDRVWWLVGRRSIEMAEAVGAGAGGPGPDRDVLSGIRPFGHLPGVVLAAPGADSQALRESLADAGALDGGDLDGPPGRQLQVLAGAPVAGRELTPERFPLEAGLIDEVSFTKGCYPGQETVARQDTYDKVARRLVALGFDEPVDERSALEGGRGQVVTSVAPRRVSVDERDLVVALGYVRRASAEPGERVALEARPDCVARVLALPLEPLRGALGGSST